MPDLCCSEARTALNLLSKTEITHSPCMIRSQLFDVHLMTSSVYHLVGAAEAAACWVHAAISRIPMCNFFIALHMSVSRSWWVAVSCCPRDKRCICAPALRRFEVHSSIWSLVAFGPKKARLTSAACVGPRCASHHPSADVVQQFHDFWRIHSIYLLFQLRFLPAHPRLKP